MVETLAELLDDFHGELDHSRCFTHTVNLVVKTILQQFDVQPSRLGVALEAAERSLKDLANGRDIESSGDADLVDARHTQDRVKKLKDLAVDLDSEEAATVEKQIMAGEYGCDDLDGWVDGAAELVQLELKNLREDVMPVQTVLVKVCDLFSS